MDEDTAYLQPDEDEEGRIDLRHETLDLEYLGAPRADVRKVDMRSADINARTVDLMGLEADENIYAWAATFDTDLDVSHSSSDNLYLRSAEGRDVNARETEIRDRLELSRSSFGTVDLGGAEVGLLHAEDADIGAIDLSGATVGEIDVDAAYDLVIDEGTEIGELPEGRDGMRVYEETTANERDVLTDVGAYGDIDAERLDDPSYTGAVGSLRSKDLLLGGDDGYDLSDRSEAFLEYL